jgi:hypothetical protein
MVDWIILVLGIAAFTVVVVGDLVYYAGIAEKDLYSPQYCDVLEFGIFIRDVTLLAIGIVIVALLLFFDWNFNEKSIVNAMRIGERCTILFIAVSSVVIFLLCRRSRTL